MGIFKSTVSPFLADFTLHFSSLFSTNPDPTDAKMTFWRQAGLNYIQFSQVAARVVRKSLKPGPKAEADKRGDGMVKMKKWVGGKPEGVKDGEGYLKPSTSG